MAGRLALAALSLLAAIGCQSPRERSGTAMATDAPATRPFISCESLAQEVKWMPWLSEPGSRLVLNPTVGNQARNLTPATVPGLPMSLAYFVGERPVTMPAFWSWSVAKQGDAAAIKPHDLGADHAAWRVEGGSVGRDGTSARITIHPGPVAFIERSITADLSQTPWLLVTVPALPDGVSFAVKVNDARGGPDIFLQRDTRQPQTGAYDVAAATGWTGERTFNVRLFAVGKEGQHVVFDAPKLVAGPDVTPLQSTGVTWEPHRVRAKAAGGGMRIESTIAFPHLDSVAQSITVTDGEGALVLSGDVSGGEAHWDESRRELSIVYEHFTATLATSATGQPTRFGGVWRDRQHYLEGEAPTAATPGGVWELAFDVRSGDRVVVTATFEKRRPGLRSRLGLHIEATTPEQFDEVIASRAEGWQQMLSRVPHPPSFDLTAIDPTGVTSEQVRQSYYKAWAFILATVLPPMPENGYAYPQVACGKPSTWDEGHERASASAQWESMIGMQLLALVDPQTAWGAYDGMMSLVDERGMMGGEGLPSRHAQTAWVLYELTNDRERLRAIYPPLKRMLKWKISDPRWIYKAQTPAGQKDAEFVAHALLDTGYALRITQALGMKDEDAFWQQQSDAVAANFKQWFWEHPGDVPYRIYEASTQKRHDRGGSWALQALALPPETLGQPERDSLLKLLRKEWKIDRPFLLPNLTKHATYLLAARGMLRYGTREEAIQMLEAGTRDVIRAGEFAEFYEQGSRLSPEPTPLGVTPSIFGAAMVIDAWLLRNGISIGDGQPQADPRVRGSSQATATTRPGTRASPR